MTAILSKYRVLHFAHFADESINDRVREMRSVSVM